MHSKDYKFFYMQKVNSNKPTKKQKQPTAT